MPYASRWFFLLLILFTYGTKAMSEKLTLLVFGGNGFIGSHVVQQLLADGHRLVLTNRDKWYWDTGNSIRPHVETIYCDRLELEQKTHAKLLETIDSVHFDAVIDFSAYRLDAVRPFYSRLRQASCDLYVYISTDSVYEVCEIPHSEPACENDAIRPATTESQLYLNSRDKYGHRKLEIEEYLKSQLEEGGGIPFVILRLPDVLGERDSTDRFWKYLLWLQFNSVLQIPVDDVPSFTDSLKSSYVDVLDVAQAVRLILSKRSSSLVQNQIFNCGFRESYTLRELLISMHTELQLCLNTGENAGANSLQNDVLNSSSPGDRIYFFPSVLRGSINVSKIEEILGFVPRDWVTSINRMVQFYVEALTKFPQERDEAVKNLVADFGVKLSDANRQHFVEAVHREAQRLSGIYRTESKDEL